jgi:flagellar P-ring protein precursor FlgI
VLKKILLVATLLVATAAHAGLSPTPKSVRIKDLGRLEGWRENALVGYGLVTGLAGTGDSPRNRATRQSIANMMSRFDMTTVSSDVASRNVAAVMITASLPPFARPGDTLDVTVTSVGDARSLTGGMLILAPMKGPDGRVYALAQGAVSVGGYRYDANGNVVQKNHPTVGVISSGASVEVGVADQTDRELTRLTFILEHPDFTTATRIANGINAALGRSIATARDASAVKIDVSDMKADTLATLMTRIEAVYVMPDTRARVVINERTGTVVAGGDVTIAPVSITHGDLKVQIATQNTASQPILVSGYAPSVQSMVVTNTHLDVADSGESHYVPPTSTTVADLVQSLVKLKIGTRDIISILQATRAAGALNADIVVQ